MAVLVGTAALMRMGVLVHIRGTVFVNMRVGMDRIFPENRIKCPESNDHQDQAHQLLAVSGNRFHRDEFPKQKEQESDKQHSC